MIQFFQRKEIDTNRWNDVIASSPAETIYPYSWYLDAAAENWSAFVGEDYRFVMPVIWRKRFGIRYAFHPPFVQQLGVFGREVTDPFLLQQFLREVGSAFRFGNIQLNSQNMIGEEPGWEVSDRRNYELLLDRDYDTLYGHYSTNAKRNLKKALDHHPEISEDITLDELIQLKIEAKISNRDNSYINWINNLFTAILDRGRGKVIGVRQEGRLIAGVFFAFSLKRSVYLLSASCDEGMETRAMFAIVDRFIRQNAGSGIILDFEGSNIPSIARFFSGFGAEPTTYQAVSFGRFPFPLRKLKKHG
ncbi:MAG: hypothetical protein JXR52_07250 [Bacteroidales bacterium]|nr:hypothetical protein [Bacteroidales bacterium]